MVLFFLKSDIHETKSPTSCPLALDDVQYSNKRGRQRSARLPAVFWRAKKSAESIFVVHPTFHFSKFTDMRWKA